MEKPPLRGVISCGAALRGPRASFRDPVLMQNMLSRFGETVVSMHAPSYLKSLFTLRLEVQQKK
jgi:hypothetical protein